MTCCCTGIFKSGNPAERAKAIVHAVTHYDDAKEVAKASEPTPVHVADPAAAQEPEPEPTTATTTEAVAEAPAGDGGDAATGEEEEDSDDEDLL